MSNAKINKINLIYKGAEASLYHGYWFGKEVIFKYRLPKKYRVDELDKKIRITRTLNEARALIKVKSYGLNVPQIFEIDAESATIVMKFIQGKKLRDLLPQLDNNKKISYFEKIGQFIAILHKNSHIHGDITTGNIIITPNEEVFLIDFGLHDYSDSIEDKSVDLHLLKRVLLSSHGSEYELCFHAFLQGYKKEFNFSKESEIIIKKIAAIESRGRYVKKNERL
jgi:TP53 regulating kinase-like protein